MQDQSRTPRPVLTAALLCATLFLTACQSDEERAEEYFQSGVSLLEAGETERALLELRNVFLHDGFHKEARQTYADSLMTLGRTSEAYSQYLRLIEQYPDTVEVRRRLAEMAIDRNDWAEAERHGTAAIALAPDDLDIQALGLVLQYREASMNRDDDAREQTARDSAALLEQLRARNDAQADNAALVRIVIENLMSGPTPADALPAIDDALERTPQALDLHIARARLLSQLEDTAGTGAQLQRMSELFPDNTEVQQGLIRWYLAQSDIDGAEAYLRQLAGPETGPTDGHVKVVQLIATQRSTEAAHAELERLIAANKDTGNARVYIAMLGRLQFETGQTEAGVATLRRGLEGAPPDDQTRQMMSTLAWMLTNTNAQQEANALVADILAQDPRNVAALKMHASELIESDKSGEAIVELRTALDQAPRDSGILMLMALAHERSGDRDLMGERLALAVEVSESGPQESVRYARFLMEQDRLVVATTVLEDARRRAPENVDVLLLLAKLHLQQRNWPAAQLITQTLSSIDDDKARQIAPELQAAILQGQNRTEDSLAILEAQMDSGAPISGQTLRAVVMIVQAQISNGKISEARAFLDRALAETPDFSELQLLSAKVDAMMGNMDAAEAGYRDLVDRFPNAEVPVRMLMDVLAATGRQAEAETVLEEALVRQPAAPSLLWMKASLLERDGDMEGAIAVYETLYAADAQEIIIANNLASMLTTHRSDEESLDRAWTIARRLRGTDVPAYQDTYGWIAYRRGNLDEALEYLEPAAASLSQDPLSQYHLGMTYAGLGRTEEARATLTRALDLAAESPLPQFDTARETLASLAP